MFFFGVNFFSTACLSRGGEEQLVSLNGASSCSFGVGLCCSGIEVDASFRNHPFAVFFSWFPFPTYEKGVTYINYRHKMNGKGVTCLFLVPFSGHLGLAFLWPNGSQLGHLNCP
jgi:hypothetical protein